MILELHRPLVCFDLETTGLDVETARIVEFGLVALHPDGSRSQLVERVDPGIDIPEVATKVHGIRTEDVRGLFGRPPLGKLGEQMVAFIGDGDLAGFNARAYDLPILTSELARHGIPFAASSRRLVDVQIIFHALETGWDRFLMGPRNLSAAVRHYCGRDLEGAHTAAADANATLDVLLAQLRRYPDLPRNVQGLHDFGAEAARRHDRRPKARR